MIYGAAGAGARVMTSSSSPGISLMQEGLSYMASAQLPCLVVNVVRGGPGLGTIQPSQSDYFQATKGGGHGDYNLIVLAPSSVQEMADFVFDAFRLAEKYRNPAMILTDGALGQMMEKVILPEEGSLPKPETPWATTGKPKTRDHNIITSLYIQPEEMEDIKVGLLRPITLYPFPTKRIKELAEKVDFMMSVEMNAGQMVQDVKLAVEGKVPVHFKGRMGGMIPTPEEIVEEIEMIVEKQSLLQV
jgi:2-oxoglutarate ferredoxin oxidoreductase subunit alpha